MSMASMRWMLVLAVCAAEVQDCPGELHLLQARAAKRSKAVKRQRSSNFALPFGYSVLGPGRSVAARLLLPITMPCPTHLRLIGGPFEEVPVHVRAEPHVGLHGKWSTEGKHHGPKINYSLANPQHPFTYEDRVCEALYVPGLDVKEAVFILKDGSEVNVPVPPRHSQRYLVMGDTGLKVAAKNDGWCAEKLGKPATLYGEKTCPAKSLLQDYNASLVSGMFQRASGEADPAKNGWPFEEVCENALALSQAGDVVIHTGDYTYSHGACPFPFPQQPPSGEGRVFGDCTGIGSAWGDTSAGWIREFFAPASGLLQKFPWIVLRGNHETCVRSGHGWFRYLDPRPSATFKGGEDVFSPYCVTHTDPYNVEFDHDNWLVLDSNFVKEKVGIDSYPPLAYTKVDAEAAQEEPVLSMDHCNTNSKSGDDFLADFRRLAHLSQPQTTRQWLASHRPLFGVSFQDEGAGPNLYSFQCELTDGMAKANVSFPNIAAVVSGHFHSWQMVEFQTQRPAQLVVGNSGTQLATPRDGSSNGLFRAVGRPLLGAKISYSETVGEFGWTQLDLSENITVSAFFLGDEAFQSHPEIHRTLVPRTLHVHETWMS